MKKIYITTLIVLGLINLNAQIIIEETDFAELGQQYLMVVDTIGLADEQILLSSYGTAPWDFTALENNGSDTIEFILPSQTNFSTEFPEANMVMNYQNLGLGFVNKSVSHVKLEGLVVNDQNLPEGFEGVLTQPFVFDLDDAQGDDILLMEFPMTMGSQLSNTKSYADEGYGSDLLAEYGIDPAFVPAEYQGTLDVTYLYITINVTVESEVDDYGLLQIPGGEFETLRQMSNTGVNLNVEAWSFVGNIPLFDTTMTTTSYSWYAKEEGVPVLTVQVDENGYINNYLYKDISMSAAALKSETEYSLYPIPAKDKLNISCFNTEASQVVIYDMLAKKVYEDALSVGLTELNVSNLPKGMYLVNIFNSQLEVLYNSRVCIHD